MYRSFLADIKYVQFIILDVVWFQFIKDYEMTDTYLKVCL